MGNRQPRTHTAVTGSRNVWRTYADVMVGSRSLGRLFYFEWCALWSMAPGAMGMLMRKMFWPRLFGSCGKGVQFGVGITLRHPQRIHLGNRVVLGENCVLDARTPDACRVIELGDDVMVSAGVMISCKGGAVSIGANSGLGPSVVIQSTTGEPVVIGRDGIIGAGCYLTGGGNYNTDRLDVPIRLQGKRPMGGLTLGEDVWLGARCTLLGGVAIGRGTVVGAGSVVTRDLPELSVCVGTPARVIRRREAAPTGSPS